MTTQPVSTTAPNQIKSSRGELKAEDFIKMMLTQLQHQDPLEPAKNQELMAQMNQIGQLQSSTQLQETLKAFAIQNQISSAGNLIGKLVEGLDAANEPVSGVVTAVRVSKEGIILELDNGQALPLDRVTAIAPAPAESLAPAGAS
jgi:flagellar basal-body rod modification protein FlgD